MIFNLLAEAEEVAEGGLSLGIIIGLVVVGSIILAGWILGVVLSAIAKRKKARKKQARQEKKNPEVVVAPAPVVVAEPVEDFSHLTEEEKNVVRKYRNLYK